MKRVIRVWYCLTGRLIIGLGVFAGMCLGALMLLTTADVILRATIKAPILGAVELTEFIMVFIALSWIAYTQVKKGHVTIELVTERLPHKVRNSLNIVGSVLGLCFSGLVVWRTIDRIISIWGQGRNTFLLHIPHELPLAFICIGFLLYFLVTINTILQALGIGNPEDPTDG